MTDECPNLACPFRPQVATLQGQLTLTRQELAELRAKVWGHKRRPVPPPAEPPAPKKRGAPKGHPGWFRKTPTHVDETIEVTLDRCPDCGSENLHEDPKKVEDHLQEDIVIPQVQVTRFRHHQYWCGGCGHLVRPTPPVGELPGSYIGPTAKALAVWLRHTIKMSNRDCRRLLECFGLTVVVASVYGFQSQVRRASGGVYAAIRRAVKRSRSAHVDETGWRLNGKNAWLWGVVTKGVALCYIARSRGRKIAEALLGKAYGGTLIADFLAVYNKLKTQAKQRCLVHLLRELKKVLALADLDALTRQWGEALKAFVQRALALRKDWRARRCSQAAFWRRRAALVRELEDFTIPTPTRPIVQRLAQRVARHKQELLTFLYDLRIDPDNNRAERHLRPQVLLRKLVFGSRSEAGVLNYNVIMSVLQTAKLHGQDEWRVLRRLLTLPPRQRTLAVVTGRGPRSPCR